MNNTINDSTTIFKEAGIVYIENLPIIVPDSKELSKTRRELRKEEREERKKCCRLPNGLTIYDLYSLPQEEFEQWEKAVPGAMDMHPYCLAEIIGHARCNKNKTTVNGDSKSNNDDDELIVLDAFIYGLADIQNKTLREIKDNIKFCEASNMPMDKVRNKTWITSVVSLISFRLLSGTRYLEIYCIQSKNMPILRQKRTNHKRYGKFVSRGQA